MLNLRMFAIAGALALFVPVGVLADPPSDTVEAAADAVAEVTDVQLLKPAAKPQAVSYGRMTEQLVEGHTTFVTLDVVSEASPLEGNVSIEGFLDCSHSAEARYTWWYGIPVPTSFDHARVECHVGERVIVTPSIYCTISGNPGCSASMPTSFAPVMRPTGRLLPVDTPGGDHAYAEELVFTATVPDERGILAERNYYAWATPVLAAWEGQNGLPKNFLMPIPLSGLAHNDDDNYDVILESDANHAW